MHTCYKIIKNDINHDEYSTRYFNKLSSAIREYMYMLKSLGHKNFRQSNIYFLIEPITRKEYDRNTCDNKEHSWYMSSTTPIEDIRRIHQIIWY